MTHRTWSSIIVAPLLLAACGSQPPQPPQPTADAMSDEALARIEQQVGGRLGVGLVGEGGTVWRSHRGDERFAMCSTFKLALAAAILERIDEGRLGLDDVVTFGPDDLMSYAPVVSTRVDEGRITISELAEAAVTLSDNSAANLLLARVDGPEGLTAFVRRHGDEMTRLDRIEPDLNENRPGDERDTTTPAAMAGLVHQLVLEDGLGAESRRRLSDWLVATSTGLQRIRAGLPEGWRAGDKTGTCSTAYNDIAVVWPPDSTPFVLTVYIDHPTAEPDEINAVFGEIAGLAADLVRERPGG